MDFRLSVTELSQEPEKHLALLTPASLTSVQGGPGGGPEVGPHLGRKLRVSCRCQTEFH